MLTILLSLVLLALPTAEAGKLAEGFRGRPFGDAAWLATAPMEGCQKAPEPTVAWLCPTTIGTVPVCAAYLVDEGVFMGVFIQAKGWAEKVELLATLKAAWGPGKDAAPRLEGFWIDGDVLAGMDYNRYSDGIQVTISSKAAEDLVKRRKAARVAGAAGDL